MDGLLNAIVTLVSDDESAPGLALVVVGAVAWGVSVVVGVMTPAALIDTVGRVAVAASTLSVVVLAAGLLLVATSGVG